MKARARWLLPLTLGLLLAACGAAEETPPSSAEAETPTAAPAASAVPSATPAPTGGATPEATAIAEDPPPLALEQVAGDMQAPINIAATPDGWLLVNERGGRVVAIDPGTGRREVVLDITDRVGSGGEQGLLGLAVHPDWPERARAFVHYTDRNGDTVLSEFRVTDDPLPPRLDPTSERVLLRVDQPYANHNGGQLAFGPDGELYMALGDGGSGGDPHGNGQNPATLLGAILRIDPDPPDDAPDPDSMPYGIPDGNPFADGADGAPEVFLYGLRNPWRFSFDRQTGLLWIADVGQNATEEVNRIDPATEAGANLGWNLMEGAHCFATTPCDIEGLTMPVAEYGREFGCSVTGGHVYRGEAIAGLRGWYLFGDYCTGILFGIRSDAEGVIAPRTLLETGLNLSSFGEGADGELYLADLESGAIYRIVAGD